MLRTFASLFTRYEPLWFCLSSYNVFGFGNKVMLGAQSGVPGSLKDNQELIGTPPMTMTNYFRSQAIVKRLPEMYRQMNEMQKTIKELEQKIKELGANS